MRANGFAAAGPAFAERSAIGAGSTAQPPPDYSDVAAKASPSNADRRVRSNQGDNAMLHYAIVFFVIALIAAVFGFTGIAAGAAEIAKILFYLFLVVFVVTLLLGVLRG